MADRARRDVTQRLALFVSLPACLLAVCLGLWLSSTRPDSRLGATLTGVGLMMGLLVSTAVLMEERRHR